MQFRPLLVSILALSCAGLFGVTACTAGSGNGSSNKGDDDDDDDDDTKSSSKKKSGFSETSDDDDDDTEEDCKYPAAQGPTQPCCTALGIDACGAKLFCAALEGRKVAVCYAERSSKGDDPCKEDRECQSEKCIDKKCAFLQGEDCSGPDATCASTSTTATKPIVCARAKREQPYTYSCTMIGTSNGQCRACATAAADCGGGAGVDCVDNACVYDNGTTVGCF